MKHEKQKYEKPKIEQIELKTEEAILTGCKLELSTQDPTKIGQCNKNFRCVNYGS